jgi:O-antigen ligase
MSSANEHIIRPEAAVAGPVERGEHNLAFAGLFLFTLLLYMRPNEMFPEVFGSFPIIKIVALLALATYTFSRLGRGQSLTIWPLELKMLGVIILLGLIFIPIAKAPQDSIDVLTDELLKVACIFVLMINLITTRARLNSFFKLVVVCGAVLAVFAIRDYLTGEFGVKSGRIWGVVGGMFGNPNDLASSFDLLLPLGIYLALVNRGLKRALYLVACVLLIAAVILTFSRSGFLGLLTALGVSLWKLGRDRRALAATAFIVLLGAFVVVMPAGYAARMKSMFNIDSDPTGSAQLRRSQLERAFDMALRHPVVGIGIGNYHIYSLREQRAHNSYLEISAELGVAGLIAYLILIFGPLRALARIERENTRPAPKRAVRPSRSGRSPDDDADAREFRYLSISLQASIAAYLVCSFFASIQYLWYLYYLIAYAIALRAIYEAAIIGAKPAEAATTRQKVKGVAWRKSRQLTTT